MSDKGIQSQERKPKITKTNNETHQASLATCHERLVINRLNYEASSIKAEYCCGLIFNPWHEIFDLSLA
jgi:hypothetical protein